ncbi:TPA: hypothetical protein [Aquificae Conch Spring virus]|nr:TPA: hypothetical protein [Aquificae Conch Spring virus]
MQVIGTPYNRAYSEIMRLEREKLRKEIEKFLQTYAEQKRLQQEQSVKSQTEPKIAKRTTQKVTTTQQLTERDLLNFVVKEIKDIYEGKKSLYDSKLFEDIKNEQEKIRTDLQNTLQEYNNKIKELADFTQKFNDAHSKMIGLFALLLGKSDLMRHTNEHLFDKMRELILYYPVDVVPLAMKNLIVGYFAGKQAGIDTDGMSVGELIVMGENPEIVAKLSPKSVEFLGQLIEVMPQIFQMKVAPYRIMLDKLQNEAKILETRQTHLEQMLLRSEQNALRRLQLLEMLLNYLLTAKTKKEIAKLQAETKIKVAEMKKQEKEEKSFQFVRPEDRKQIEELAGK